MNDQELIRARLDYQLQKCAADYRFCFRTVMNLAKKHHLKVADLKIKECDELGWDDDEYGCWDQAAMLGIRSVFELKLRTTKRPLWSDTCTIPNKIQIAFVDAIPRPTQTWENFITSSFDMDVVKGVAKIDCRATLGELAFDADVLNAIHTGRFSCTIRPCVAVRSIIKRICKCRYRGFTLESFDFSDECQPDCKHLVMEQFHCIFGGTFCRTVATTFRLVVPEPVIGDYVLPKLLPASSSPAELRRVQEDHIESCFAARLWRTPGLTKMTRTNLHASFRVNARKRAAKKIKKWLLAQHSVSR